MFEGFHILHVGKDSWVEFQSKQSICPIKYDEVKTERYRQKFNLLSSLIRIYLLLI